MDTTTDDYKHIILNHRVIKGNYLEVYADEKERFTYYVEEAIISSLCMIGTNKTRKENGETSMDVFCVSLLKIICFSI